MRVQSCAPLPLPSSSSVLAGCYGDSSRLCLVSLYYCTVQRACASSSVEREGEGGKQDNSASASLETEEPQTALAASSTIEQTGLTAARAGLVSAQHWCWVTDRFPASPFSCASSFSNHGGNRAYVPPSPDGEWAFSFSVVSFVMLKRGRQQVPGPVCRVNYCAAPRLALLLLLLLLLLSLGGAMMPTLQTPLQGSCCF